jgi:hypothetical protein
VLIHGAAIGIQVYLVVSPAAFWVTFSRPGDWPLVEAPMTAGAALPAGAEIMDGAGTTPPPVDTAMLWTAMVAGVTGRTEGLSADREERLRLLAGLAEYDLAVLPTGGPLTGGTAWELHAGADTRALFRELHQALADRLDDPAAVPDLAGAVLRVEADPDSAGACWYLLDLAGDGGRLSACSSGETIEAVAADLVAQKRC